MVKYHIGGIPLPLKLEVNSFVSMLEISHRITVKLYVEALGKTYFLSDVKMFEIRAIFLILEDVHNRTITIHLHLDQIVRKHTHKLREAIGFRWRGHFDGMLSALET